MGNTINEPTNQYLGVHMQPLRLKKERKKNYRHPIFLFTPNGDEEDPKDYFKKLSQIVNIYEHTLDDFEFNSKKIIKHFKSYYGDTKLLFVNNFSCDFTFRHVEYSKILSYCYNIGTYWLGRICSCC